MSFESEEQDPYKGIRVISEEVSLELQKLWTQRVDNMSAFERAVHYHTCDDKKKCEIISYWIDDLEGCPTQGYYDWVVMNWGVDDDIRQKEESKKRRLGNTPAEQDFEDKCGYCWWEPEGWERGGEEFAMSMGYGGKERESRFRYEVTKG